MAIEVRGTKDSAVLRVRDNGAGMTEDLLSRIFEPFVQGPPLPDRVQSGLGIGLALVQQLVTLHGGTIHGHSDGEGKGSLFTVTFQRSPDGKPEEATVSQPASLHGRLLLVEDNQDARSSMAELLRSLGHEVAEAGDGAEAMKACGALVPDIVIMDIGLPDQSGYDLAARFRSNPATSAIPLVALTGYGRGSDKDKALAAGFSAHMVKPVDTATLIALIDALLADRSAGG